MHIALIVAMTERGVIGANNALPWHLPEELKYFRKTTLGKPVIMGRSTFQSMGNKPLPNRLNIILTRDKNFLASDCQVVHSVPEAIKAAGECEEIIVIGGAKVYKQFLPLADRLYVTIIHQDYPGDTFFPAVDWKQWETISEQPMEGFTIKVFDKYVKEKLYI